MSVLFCSIIESVAPAATKAAVFSAVIGSNVGAFLTPIGALAGIMWSSILKEHGHKFGYLDFLRIGVTIAIPTILTALGVLALIV
jgi:arsenical pump membrane protein